MKVCILGLARSGYAAAILSLKLGYTVGVTDAAKCEGFSGWSELTQKADYLKSLGAEVELEGHSREFLAGADLVITSPGVPEWAEPILWAREDQIEIISELEFAVRNIQAEIIGVTGTNGKTTTTSLIGHMLKSVGRKVVVAGNIGVPLSELVDQITAEHIVVLEVSSFQLETIKNFKAHIAIWLNFTPDHLDRHKTMQKYFEAKSKIFMNMTKNDWAVVWHNDRQLLAEVLSASPAKKMWVDQTGRIEATNIEPNVTSCRDGKMISSREGQDYFYGTTDQLKLMGQHNIINVITCCAVAAILDLPQTVVATALASFEALEHRIEFVAEINGVRYINDSKATNVEAMIEGLKAVPQPIALIAGGYDKGIDFDLVKTLIKTKTVKVVLLGAMQEKLSQAFAGLSKIEKADSMLQALEMANEGLGTGATVLLSPGCASYGSYKNFEERGNDFKKCVKIVNNKKTGKNDE